MLIRSLSPGPCLLALIFAAMPTQAQPLPEADAYLAKLKVSYEANLMKIREADQAVRKTLLKKYAYNLLEIERKLKETGQLDPLLVTRREIARFKQEGSLEGAEVEGSTDLQRLLAAYRKLFDNIDLTSNKRLYNLSGKYDQSLRRLEASYTKENRIADAVKVREERDAVRQRPDVLAAMKAAKETKSATQLQQPDPENWKPVRPGPGNVAPGIANQFKGSDKKRIDDRYHDFIEALIGVKDNNMDAVVEMVNPEDTKKLGEQLIGLTFAPAVIMVQFADKAGGKFREGNITVGEDGNTAVQIPYFSGAG
ncbi:MAG: hypothetical protein VCG02_08205, partial [Verrucomicrobiota bacterium]